MLPDGCLSPYDAFQALMHAVLRRLPACSAWSSQTCFPLIEAVARCGISSLEPAPETGSSEGPAGEADVID